MFYVSLVSLQRFLYKDLSIFRGCKNFIGTKDDHFIDKDHQMSNQTEGWALAG